MTTTTVEDIRQQIAKILEVDVEKVVPAAKFKEDLGADSLDLVELLVELEEVLGRELGDEETENISSVGDLLDYLKKKGLASG